MSNSREVKISKKKYPESAKHIENAIDDGQPDILTLDRGGASSRRKAALKGVKRISGLDRDEYPPSMSKEGGFNSSVVHINPPDNRGSGASGAAQLRPYPDGTRFKYIIVDED